MRPRTHHLTRRALGAVAAMSLVLAACGGGSDDASSDDAPVEADDETSSDADDAGDAEPSDAADDAADDDADDAPGDDAGDDAGGDIADISAATFEASEIGYRTVNLLDEPVDLYVITNGIREAFVVETGVAPGAVTEFASPPADSGRYLITTAGAGDPTCVVDCDHHIIEATTSFAPEGGSFRTVIVYPNPESGEPTSFETYEVPDASLQTGNALPLADASTTTIAVSALGVPDLDFGLNLSVEGTEGCFPNRADDARRIGGNQIVPFDTGDVGTFSIHGSEDRDCTGDPIGGPFEVQPGPGQRYHVMLTGTLSGLDATIVELVDGLPDTSADADPAAREEAIALVADAVVEDFPLAPDEATCLAGLIVDRIGADVLVVDGVLIELEDQPSEVVSLAEAALVESVDACGIDPSQFGA